MYEKKKKSFLEYRIFYKKIMLCTSYIFKDFLGNCLVQVYYTITPSRLEDSEIGGSGAYLQQHWRVSNKAICT